MVIVITACFIALDLITGFVKGVYSKSINSTKMRKGLFTKSAFAFIIVLALLCEWAMAEMPELGFNLPILSGVCVFIILLEVVSIIENIASLNGKIMDTKLLQLFNVSKEEISNGQQAKND